MNNTIAASNRRTALICTDQTEFVVELQRKLQSYDIETCDRLEYLLDILKTRKNNNELPDILLLELYWKKDESITIAEWRFVQSLSGRGMDEAAQGCSTVIQVRAATIDSEFVE